MFHFARFPHRHTIREPSLSSSSSSSTPSTATTSTMAVVNDTKDMTSLNQSAIPQPPLHTEAVWESYGFSKNDVSHVKKGIIRVCFVPFSVTPSLTTHTHMFCSFLFVVDKHNSVDGEPGILFPRPGHSIVTLSTFHDHRHSPP